MTPKHKNKSSHIQSDQWEWVSLFHVGMTTAATARQEKGEKDVSLKTGVPSGQWRQADSHSYQITSFLWSLPGPGFKPEVIIHQYHLHLTPI